MLLQYIILTLVSIFRVQALEATKASKLACQCFDLPACPRNQLAGKSLCACENQAELFCWRRNGQATCPSPLPYDCENIPANGVSTRISALATAAASGTPSFTPTYTGESGLNCVDLGYCFRPTKARTTMTITMPSGTAIITVPIGLPTIAAPTSETSAEPIIVFTPDALRKRAEETVGSVQVPRTTMAL